MPRSLTIITLCALLVRARSADGQAASSQQPRPADYAAIAAADFRVMSERLARLRAQSEARTIAECANLAVRCQLLHSRGAESSYEARLLEAGSYVALLPPEVKVRGVPYYSWAPTGALVRGDSTLARWRALAAARTVLGCQDDACTVLVLEEPNERHSETTIAACRAERTTDPPARCETLAILAPDERWLRAVVGWGDSSVAASLQPSPIVEDFEVERRLSILQLPATRRGAIVQAIDAALRASPLLLSTEFRPPVNPNAVKGRRATELSHVIERFREWSSVRADLDPAVSAGDTTISTIELTTTLWLSISASPQPTRPANAAESAKYVARVLENVTREVARVCGASFVGDRIVCR